MIMAHDWWPSSVCPLKEVENKVWFQTGNCSKILTMCGNTGDFFFYLRQNLGLEIKNMQFSHETTVTKCQIRSNKSVAWEPVTHQQTVSVLGP